MYIPPAHLACPSCRSANVEILAVFGTGPSDATALCHECRTNFSFLRVGEAAGDRNTPDSKNGDVE